jgi:hypothetical protein
MSRQLTSIESATNVLLDIELQIRSNVFWSRVGTTLNVASNYDVSSFPRYWTQSGTESTIFPGPNGPTITSLTNSEVAYYDSNTDRLRTYTRNDFNYWSEVTSGLIIPTNGAADIATLTGSEIAYINSNSKSLITYTRNNSNDWSQIGTTITISGLGIPSLATLTSSEIVISDGLIGQIGTYTRNSSNQWTQIGTITLINSVFQLKIATLTSSEVGIFLDSTSYQIGTYTRNSSNQWTQIGTDLNISGIGTAKLATLTSSNLAFIDSTLEKLSTYTRNSSNQWFQVDSQLDIPGISDFELSGLNETEVIFIDRNFDLLQVYKFNESKIAKLPITSLTNSEIALIGDRFEELRTYTRSSSNQWTQIGTGLSIPNVSNPAIVSLTSSTVGFVDDFYKELSTYTRSSSNQWSQVGTGLGISSINNPALTKLTTNELVLVDDFNKKLNVYSWSNSTWVIKGASTDVFSITNPSLSALTSTEVALCDDYTKLLRVFEWDGSSIFTQIGTSITIANISNPSINAISNNELAFIDGTNEELFKYIWDSRIFSQIGSGFNIPNISFPSINAISNNELAFIDGELTQLESIIFNGVTQLFNKNDIIKYPKISWEIDFGGGFGKPSTYDITIASSMGFLTSNALSLNKAETFLKIYVNSDNFTPHYGRIRGFERSASLPGVFTLKVYDNFIDGDPKIPIESIVDSYPITDPAVTNADVGYSLYYGKHVRPFYMTPVDCNISTFLGPRNVSSENHVSSFYFFNSNVNSQIGYTGNWEQQSDSTNILTFTNSNLDLDFNLDYVYASQVNCSDIAISENPNNIVTNILNQANFGFLSDQASHSQQEVNSYNFQCFFEERIDLSEILQEFGELTSTNYWVADSGYVGFRTYQESSIVTDSINFTIQPDDMVKNSLVIKDNPLGLIFYQTEKASRIKLNYDYNFASQKYEQLILADRSNNSFCSSIYNLNVRDEKLIDTKYIKETYTASLSLANYVRRLTIDDNLVEGVLHARFMGLELSDILLINHPAIIGSSDLFQTTKVEPNYETGEVYFTANKIKNLG